MTMPTRDEMRHNANSEAEQTLRLIASLPAPGGIEERVHEILHKGAQTANVLPFQNAMTPNRPWMQGAWARGAAAAAIVCVVAGGGWSVYSRVQPVQTQKVVVLPRIARPGEFSNAGAMRTPHTLVGPSIAQKPKTAVPEAVTKKPAHTAKKPGRAQVSHTPVK